MNEKRLKEIIGVFMENADVEKVDLLNELLNGYSKTTGAHTDEEYDKLQNDYTNLQNRYKETFKDIINGVYTKATPDTTTTTPATKEPEPEVDEIEPGKGIDSLYEVKK